MPRVLRMRNPMKINKSVSKKRTIDGDNINLMEDDQIDRKVSNALKQFTDTRVTVPKYRTSLQKSQQY